MTCIVAISDETKGLYFGSDSAVSGEDILQTALPKVFSRAGVIIGVCGDYTALSNLTFNLNLEEQDLHKIIGALKSCTHDPFSIGSGQSSVLVGFGLSLYQIDLRTCTATQPWSNYHAVGSGRGLAIGSLHTTADLNFDPTHRIKIALQATTLTHEVREPFTLCHLPLGSTTPTWETFSTTPSRPLPLVNDNLMDHRQPIRLPLTDLEAEMPEGLFKKALTSRYRLR